MKLVYNDSTLVIKAVVLHFVPGLGFYIYLLSVNQREEDFDIARVAFKILLLVVENLRSNGALGESMKPKPTTLTHILRLSDISIEFCESHACNIVFVPPLSINALGLRLRYDLVEVPF